MFTPVQTKQLITPGNFFDKQNNRKEFEVLNDFIRSPFNLSLRYDFGQFNELWLYPYIGGKLAYFKDSKITEMGGGLKAWNFEDLMYKLCAMIIGEQKVQIVSTDFRDLYTFLYQIETKELRLLGRFQRREDEQNFITRNECRSCGVKWPLG